MRNILKPYQGLVFSAVFVSFLSANAFSQEVPDVTEPVEPDVSEVQEEFSDFVGKSENFSQAVYINQLGNDNRTNIQQQDGDNTAHVSITGNNNGADGVEGQITQKNATNTASVIVVGDRNDFDISQDGLGGTNKTSLYQSGTDNDALIEQSSVLSSTNSAELWQVGNGNQLTVNQVNAVAAYNNEVRLFQDGTDNSATLTQNGGNNTINATQVGDTVSATFTQNGFDNTLISRQDGTNLNYGITQDGGATISIIQTNTFTSPQ
ncbi:hypothetical protein [Pseudemcibacter aquimaris]|uniref:hypothetical protein n=1 Tax=Pseudemcibacter aquimaris TaxID=2857064 RepID=UPI002013022F|nr:hypothetical protein [Pseudemcibacter aquimaris]MCC3859755.1 hypothetical protein [Pseudemcibacter aquimaris]WDU60149.1 hypothetical protein KW060_07745 [Pseudemcibacter aquimaris]